MTKNINISIKTAYIPEHSNELEKKFVFSYTIDIKNNTREPVQLLSRYWSICDANGDKSTVVGEGVIGQQPIIQSGKHFTYTSGCVLKTPVGTMEGHYQMINQQKKTLQCDIPIFRLAMPNIVN